MSDVLHFDTHLCLFMSYAYLAFIDFYTLLKVLHSILLSRKHGI
jgi:hypothetical protein